MMRVFEILFNQTKKEVTVKPKKPFYNLSYLQFSSTTEFKFAFDKFISELPDKFNGIIGGRIETGVFNCKYVGYKKAEIEKIIELFVELDELIYDFERRFIHTESLSDIGELNNIYITVAKKLEK